MSRKPPSALAAGLWRAAAGKHATSPAARLVTRSQGPLGTSCTALLATQAQRARFSSSPAKSAKNQIFSPVRNNDTFYTYLSTSSSARIPLLTLWTASWCPTCRTVEPFIRSLVDSGIGEEEGGVALTTVEFDSPDIMSAGADSLAMTYMITSIPTLLSFDAGEAQTTTKVVDGKRLADHDFLVEWIRNEARRHGGRGGGGGGFSFGGLFGRS